MKTIVRRYINTSFKKYAQILNKPFALDILCHVIYILHLNVSTSLNNKRQYL